MAWITPVSLAAYDSTAKGSSEDISAVAFGRSKGHLLPLALIFAVDAAVAEERQEECEVAGIASDLAPCHTAAVR